MAEHFAYWKSSLEAGEAVAFGLVLDRGMIAAADEAAAGASPMPIRRTNPIPGLPAKSIRRVRSRAQQQQARKGRPLWLMQQCSAWTRTQPKQSGS